MVQAENYIPAQVNLHDRDVHVWGVHRDRYPVWAERCWAVLSADERQRAGRFHFDRDRELSVLARGLLRQLLSAYAARPAAELRFTYTKYGKPVVADLDEPHFNVSHSDDVVLLAFTRLAPVGVDVEAIRQLPDRDGLAARVFSPRELSRFRATPIPYRDRLFFHGWTRKEAFIKAVGEGLSYPLDAFDVSFELGAPARLEQIQGSVQEAQMWTLRDLSMPEGYLAAVALPANPAEPTPIRWL